MLMVIMREGATPAEVEEVVQRLESVGAGAHIHEGEPVTTIAVEGDREAVASLPIEVYPGVDRVVTLLRPYKLVSREFRSQDTVIRLDSTQVGGGHFGLIAGPCSVETREQTLQTARFVKAAGATGLRGGAFKPRTSPYAFQGLGEEALKILAEAREETGLPVVTELMDVRHLDLLLEYADVIQVGARNMQNFHLLAAVGQVDRPVLLKRGLSATLEELLMAAEYIVREGNSQVVICERGIRTFETATRNTLDISAVPIIKQRSHLPVIVDPSHASGRVELIEPLSLAAIAAGADGLIIEAHPAPETALCDGAQSLSPSGFARTASRIAEMVAWVGKTLG